MDAMMCAWTEEFIIDELDACRFETRFTEWIVHYGVLRFAALTGVACCRNDVADSVCFASLWLKLCMRLAMCSSLRVAAALS